MLNFQIPGDVAFEVFLHLGSVLAVIIYFRKDILELIVSLIKFQNQSYENIKNRNTIFYLITATIVTGSIYYFFDNTIESIFDASNPKNILFISIFLAITGIILFVSDKISDSKINARLGIRKSAAIGIAQGFSLLPGISRSGSTIAMGIFMGMKREDAAKFSFLLSLPAILGANILKLNEFKNLESSQLFLFIVGALAAFISGYLVISVLIKLIKNKKLKIFSYYCWTISLISILLYLAT